MGWTPDGEHILYTSNDGQPFNRLFALGQVPRGGGPAQPLSLGPAASLDFDGKARVLGRHTWDIARWKRYRGGTAGQFWVDLQGRNQWKALRPGGGNLTRPLWLEGRLYFGSDHEGQGNLYSCQTDGSELRRHTDHSDFYLRRPGRDSHQIVYQCGAEIYRFVEGKSHKVEISLRAAGFAQARKFAAGGHYMDSFDLAKSGKITATVRGKALHFFAHEKPVEHFGLPQGVRYRQARWVGQDLLVVSDGGNREGLELYSPEGKLRQRWEGDWGRVLYLEVSPDGEWAAFSNQAYQLWKISLKSGHTQCLETNAYDRIVGLAWSPCSQWLAYSSPTGRLTSQLKLYELVSQTITPISEGCFRDVLPHFDPQGRYLYFLSLRDFSPVWDNLFFEMSFPNGVRPYLMTLRNDVADPFEHDPQPKSEDKKKKDKDKPAKTPPTQIDLESISSRIAAFPVPEGRYGQIVGCGDTVLFSRYPVESSLEDDPDPHSSKGSLQSYDLKSLESKEIYSKVGGFTTSSDGKWLLYRSGYRLRLVSLEKKPESNEDTPGRKSGWVAPARLRVEVEPKSEWQQMAREAWRLMQQHFWDGQAEIDWEGIFARYQPLLDRVGSRSELSDWLWELQGELGTSHAYEQGGDYAHEPNFPQGKLGARLHWDGKAYQVKELVEGDCWNKDSRNPSQQLGSGLKLGDLLTHIQGQPLSQEVTPESLLVHTARQEIQLTVRRGKEQLRFSLKPLRHEFSLRYRAWVESNRRYVHQASAGQVGYLHVPNMGPLGFSEFHRGYYSEVQKQALIVDVRYNGGGNVSGLLLEKLSRRILGWDVPRYGQPISYPMEAPRGPLVALTNEMAGSDGDIFSHCFKLLKLGPLVGTRTWGGVIGIWPRHRLVDGSQTTQPEFAFWFEDVGWKVENYGTDPDVVVENRPQDYLKGLDPQLERALQLALSQPSQENFRPPR